MEVIDEHEVVLMPHEYSKASSLDFDVKASQELRLQALQNDPASFTSSYTIESQQPLSFWINRLRNPQAKTFALVKRDSEAQSYHVPGYTPQRPWVGMLVLLGPKAVDPDAFDNASSYKAVIADSSPGSEEAQSGKIGSQTCPANSALAYTIVAVYVAPEARGKGLAKRLMRSALVAVEQDLAQRGSRKAICTISVAKGLVAARKTYESMGFVAVAEDHGKADDGWEFHGWVMRKDLAV
jgi:ribosomal protein S18 acetylase RimI-like enzyme